ncbi:hypothetical protein BC826DRAFT_548131 [Russula brevipes]|nr:hypothetical protein BC826DRAFT_548131 [Russula brevipes]
MQKRPRHPRTRVRTLCLARHPRSTTGTTRAPRRALASAVAADMILRPFRRRPHHIRRPSCHITSLTTSRRINQRRLCPPPQPPPPQPRSPPTAISCTYTCIRAFAPELHPFDWLDSSRVVVALTYTIAQTRDTTSTGPHLASIPERSHHR